MTEQQWRSFNQGRTGGRSLSSFSYLSLTAFAVVVLATTVRAQTRAVGQGPAGVTCPSDVKRPAARALGSQISVPVRDTQIPMDMFYRREQTKLFGSGYAKDGSGASIATEGDIMPGGVRIYKIHLEVGYGQLTFNPRNPAGFETNDDSLQKASTEVRNGKFNRIVNAIQHSEDLAAKAIADQCGPPLKQ